MGVSAFVRGAEHRAGEFRTSNASEKAGVAVAVAMDERIRREFIVRR